MVRPTTVLCTTVETRRHPCPGNRASALPSTLLSASLCSSREIIAPKLHGVASTILLIRVGVCWCLEGKMPTEFQTKDQDQRSESRSRPSLPQRTRLGAVL